MAPLMVFARFFPVSIAASELKRDRRRP